MSFNVKNIATRLPSNAPGWMSETITTAAALVDSLTKQAAEIDSDRKLSSEGRAERKRALLDGGLGQHLAQLRARAKSEAGRIETERAAMTLPQPDRTDLFAEMQRQEIRAFLRSLPDEKRGAYLLTEDDRKRMSKSEADRLPTVDPMTMEAILSAPPERSGFGGVNTKMFDRLRAHEVRKVHGARADQLEVEAEALANVTAAIEVASMEMTNEIGPAPEKVAA